MTGLGRQLRRMGIPKKRTAQGMFYGVKKLEKPAEKKVENVKVEVAEKEFSQSAQSSQSAEKNFSQIPQIPQNSEKNFSQSPQSAQSAEKNFSQISLIPQISVNPEESQDTHSKNFTHY